MKLLPYSAKDLRDKLERYLEQDPAFKKAYDYTKLRFDAANQLTAHNWEHCHRDTINAMVIGEAEDADMTIVLPAAVMHDIGFLYGASGSTHGSVGADNLSEYLKAGSIDYSDSDMKHISNCIRTHKGSMHNEKPESLEAKVVADADMLEKFGPIGVYQFIRTYTEFNKPIDKILGRGADIFTLSLETPTGRKLAEPGRQYVAKFFEELRGAIRPYND